MLSRLSLKVWCSKVQHCIKHRVTSKIQIINQILPLRCSSIRFCSSISKTKLFKWKPTRWLQIKCNKVWCQIIILKLSVRLFSILVVRWPLSKITIINSSNNSRPCLMPCLMLLMLSYRLDSNSLLLNLINCLMVTNNLMSMRTTNLPNLTKVLLLKMSCI